MRIITTSKELTAPEIYFLTMSPAAKKMKDKKDDEIEVSAFCLYEDAVKKEGETTGENQQILSILTNDGEIYATNSPTFIDDFMKMWELFESMNHPIIAIRVIGGKSKKDREFITCTFSR